VSLPNIFVLPCARFVAAPATIVALILVTASAASAATRAVAPVGADSGDCTLAPCASLHYAYGQSASGDVILVAPGSYGVQRVPSGSKAVTFRGGPGVVLRQMVNDASNVTYDGINVDAGRVQTDGAAFELGGSGVTVRNASLGNVVDEKVMLARNAGHTIDNVTFHDAIYRTDGTHMECLYAIGVPGFTLRNSTFRDCAVMDAFFTYGSWWTPKPPAYGNVTIENNVFGHSEMEDNSGWHYFGLYIAWIGPNGAADPMSGWTVRNNTFENPAMIAPDRGSDGSRWVGNLGSWDCKGGIAFRGNVGKACSAQDKGVSPASSSRTTTAAFGWLDPASQDFRLKPGSPAINAAAADDAPALDRLGLSRDGSPDAGAYEFGAVAPGGGPTTGGGSGRLAIQFARLRPRTICVRPRRGCPAATRLRLGVSRQARVSVRMLRLRKGRKAKRVRAFSFGVANRRTRLIRARKLHHGRYVVVLMAKQAGVQSKARRLKLRVR
jgi:hypothetical protein